MNKLCDAIAIRAPKISKAIRDEYVKNGNRDFEEVVSWCVSKFQRVTSVTQLRNTLGAGANALDFTKVIDEDAVTLIDLGSPTIGTHASRMVGTLILQQLWNAVMGRKDRKKTHIIAIDEAHLFQTNPLPQMLAEGRKFGIAMMLVHQHYRQLSVDVRDSLDSNSANFSAFRLSVKDSYDAVDKFDNEKLRGDLCRLNAFNAITTLSVDGKQTDAFTLQTSRPEETEISASVAAGIEARSHETLL